MRGLSLMRRTVRSYLSLLAADRQSDCPYSLSKRLGLVARGFLPVDCLTYDLERWSLDQYVSAVAREVKLSHIQTSYNMCLYDKHVFQLLMRSITSRMAPAFGVIRRGSVVSFDLDERRPDVDSWLCGLLQQHGRIVIKPIEGHGGAGFRILDNEADIASIAFQREALLVTRFVEQHPYASAIFPGSINTLRLLMLRDGDGVFLAAASHRFGTTRSAPVDSVSRGGLSVGVDVASGTLARGLAHPKHTDGKVVWLEQHPDTGAQIYGVLVPDWQELVDELLAITERLAFISYVGWDVVMTATGFMVIEANHNPDVSGMQINGPLLVDERVKAFYRRHGVRAP